MDKRIILAVAGSGKTTYIIGNLNSCKRTLLLTYTIDNSQTLRRKIAQKYGYIPDNISIYTYYQFLYQFCVRPLLGYKHRIKGIDWTATPAPRTSKESDRHYFTKNRRLFHNRIAKLLIEKDSVGEVCERIEKYFDVVCIDEIQDFSANDFNLVLGVCQANLDILFVGDFYQHTFDTSRDGSTRVNLHKDFDKYVREFEKAGLWVDRTTLVRSYRCGPQVCDFVAEKLRISIESHRTDDVDVVGVSDYETAAKLYDECNTVKLFYDSQSRYECVSNNWGKSKGRDDYDDVCVVLNKTTLELFESDRLDELSPTTKNKLYVALTRARGTVYLVPHTFYDHMKRK